MVKTGPMKAKNKRTRQTYVIVDSVDYIKIFAKTSPSYELRNK